MTTIITFWGDDGIQWGDEVLEWVIPPNLEIVDITHGSELPSPNILCLNAAGDPLDFSTGWTMHVLVGRPFEEARITKTTGITADANGNVGISWAPGELDVLPIGNWRVDIWFTNNATNRNLVHSFALRKSDSVRPAV